MGADKKIQPLFIVGAARSGTSYLHSLFNGHPFIKLSYESRLFTEGAQCYHTAEINNALFKIDSFNGLLDKLMVCDKGEAQNEWLVSTIDTNRNTLFHTHFYRPGFSNLVKQIFSMADSPLFFGNKMLRIEMCPDILTLFPDAKFLVLIRDPRAVCASQIKRFKSRRLQYTAMYCNTHMEWAYTHTCDSKRFKVVRYEDFVHDAYGRLKELLCFAGIWSSTAARRMLAEKPALNNKTNNWHHSLTNSQIKLIEQLCFKNMQRYGYGIKFASQQNSMGVVRKTAEIAYEKRGEIFMHPNKWRQKKILNRLKKAITP